MLFELNNNDRKYLGLSPITKDLKRVDINNNCSYFIDSSNKLVKVIIIHEPDDFYLKNHTFAEIDTEHQIDDNNNVLPKGKRGKIKPLNFKTITELNVNGMSFNWNRTATISHCKTNQVFHDSSLDNFEIKSFKELRTWIDNYIKETTDQDLVDLEKFKKEKSRRINAKDGDFFSFKTGRRSYAFGRVLINLFQLFRKHKEYFTLYDNLGLQYMASPLLVKIYLYEASTENIDLEVLKKAKAFPSLVISDRTVLKGRSPIIGNMPLEPFEFDMPIECGVYRRPEFYPYLKGFYCQWGYIFKKLDLEDFELDPVFKKLNTGLPTMFEPQYLIKKDVFNQCIMKNSILPYWEEQGTEINTNIDEDNKQKIDLRSPFYADLRKKLFSYFDIDPELSYFENYKRINDSQEHTITSQHDG